MPERRRRAFLAALVLALGCVAGGCGGAGAGAPASSGAEVRGTPEFESGSSADVAGFSRAPLAAPGELAGRLFYVPYDKPGCELHVYDLASGEDRQVGSVGAECTSLWGFTASPDGSRIAWRDSNSEIVIDDLNGGVIRLPAASNEMRDEDLGATFGPAFSPDSRYLSYCARGANDAFAFRVADVRDGHTVAELAGTCRAVLTAKGLAELRGGDVLLDGQPLELGEEQGPALAKLEPPYQIATDPSGTRIALLGHGMAQGKRKATAVVDAYDLDGNPLGRSVLEGSLVREDITLWFGIVRLAPSARSALVMWGCILQLAPFATEARFPLLYGEDGPALGFLDYSPDGRFGVLGRRDYQPLASGGGAQEAVPALDAVVLDADTLAPRYRVPVHSEFIAWSR